MSISFTVVSFFAPFLSWSQSSVTLTPLKPSVSQNFSIEGSLIKDGGFPQEVVIATVAHGKAELCKKASSFLVKAGDKTIQVPCQDYLVNDDPKIDTAFITLSGISEDTFRDLHFRAAEMAAYKTQNAGLTSCSLSGNHADEVSLVYDGNYIQSVTSHIPGCSGAALFDADGRISGIFKGFALESNRSLFTPITLKALQPLVKKLNLNQAKEVLPSSKLSSARGDPLDGNPLTANSHFKLAVPYNLIPKNDIPARYLMKYSATLKKSGETLVKESGGYFKDGYMSCSFQPYGDGNAIEIKEGFQGVPSKALDFRIFNEGRTNFQLKAHYKKGATLIANRTDNADVKSLFGNGNDSFFWQVQDKELFAITLNKGFLSITEKKTGSTWQFKDPNICSRVLSLFDPQSGLYVHYNISMHVLKENPHHCSFIDIIVRRSTSRNLKPTSQDIESYDYFETEVTLPSKPGQQCQG